MKSDTFYFLAVIVNISLGKSWKRFGQVEYLRSSGEKTFDEAINFCRNKGGLVTIFSSEENEVIKASVCRDQNECWIALTTNDEDCSACSSGSNSNGCSSCRAKWHWVDGSAVTYKNWASEEPSGDSKCARMRAKYGTWWDSPSCTEKYYAICKREYDACSSNPCQHVGSCRNVQGSFRCDCVYGYTGLLCETDINFCSNVNCENNGTCVDQLSGFRCECRKGFNGTYCEREMTESTDGSNSDEQEGLRIALYVGLTGFLLSFLILVYFALTDHTVKEKLQNVITSKRADFTNGNDMHNVPSTSRQMNLVAS